MGSTIIPDTPIPMTRMAVVTTSSTWTHPDGYGSPRMVQIIACGGGSGARNGGASIRTTAGQTSGGTGGASGYLQAIQFPMTADATIVIGSGGTGGASAVASGATTSATINYGTAGGNTTVTSGTFYTQAKGATAATATPTTANGSSAGGPNNTIGYDFGFGTGQSDGSNSSVLGIINTESTGVNGQNPLNDTALMKYAAGGGAGSVDILSATPASSSGLRGGYGFYNGGASGNSVYSATANGTATGTAGSNGGLGAGGGSGGCAQVRNATITSAVATSGKGGDGGAGYVVIIY